jgi:hypothetical protein
MKVYLVWYGVEVMAVFSTWEKASVYTDKQVAYMKEKYGYNFMPDYAIAKELGL